MKRIHYDGSHWLVGDEAASALVDFAVALAKSELAESVTIAALSMEGEPEELTLLVGPATMMASETFLTDFDEPENGATTERIRASIAGLAPMIVPTESVAIQGLDEY